jgi:hypothetical protein
MWIEMPHLYADLLIFDSVVALSKLYELGDPRLGEIQVKGDLIMPQSDRIMTRSRARAQPDQFTMIPAQLKIIKVLVEELLSASGPARTFDSNAGADLDDGDENDDEWEDEGNDFLDLGSGMTKSQLMAYGAEDGVSTSRGRDDETQAFLLNFFRQQAQNPDFEHVFNVLNHDEQTKLRGLSES